MIDESPTGELEGVDKSRFGEVVEACTLCDLCFMTKCPYVPPHQFNIDFPHLMLRHRAAQEKAGHTKWVDRALAETDRNGQLARPVAPLANWATKLGNNLTRPLMEMIAGINRNAALPKFHARTFALRAQPQTFEPVRRRRLSAAKRCSMRPASSITTTRILVKPRARFSQGTAS